jgi:hypothetical protein
VSIEKWTLKALFEKGTTFIYLRYLDPAAMPLLGPGYQGDAAPCPQKRINSRRHLLIWEKTEGKDVGNQENQ